MQDITTALKTQNDVLRDILDALRGIRVDMSTIAEIGEQIARQNNIDLTKKVADKIKQDKHEQDFSNSEDTSYGI
jgi:hypothetical protein